MFLLSLLVAFCYGAETLHIYTYDSFLGKRSLGELMKKSFEEKNPVTVQYIRFGSAGEALNQVAMEGEKTKADIVVGLDNHLVGRAKEMGAFEPFVPFDYGFLAFVYDIQKTSTIPKSLSEMAQSNQFKKKIVIEDPRTSSLGLSFLAWTKAQFPGEGFAQFWTKFSNQLLTLTPGWSAAYGMFLQGNTDFVLSYTTSPAYHIEKEKKVNIRAVIFPEGHFKQVEGVCILKKSSKRDLAKRWVEMLLSSQIQREVPTTQWMYPVKEVELPKSFPATPKAIEISGAEWDKNRKMWLKDWANLMGKR